MKNNIEDISRYTFEYVDTHGRLTSVTIPGDHDMGDIMTGFKGFLEACTFNRDTIDAYFVKED